MNWPWRVAGTLGCVLLLAGHSDAANERYTNGFPETPNFFPIGVWLQSPTRAAAYKRIGINTFVGLWKGPTETQLSELAKSGLFAVTSQNNVALSSANRQVIKAWLHTDEPDNAQPIGLGMYGPCVPSAEVVRQTQEFKARDATRPVLLNFGQGLANEFWRGRGSCTDDREYYQIASRGTGILSFDIYPVGSRTPQVKGKLEYVARGVTDLVKLAEDGQRVWAILETTALDPDRPILPAEIRAEAWMALIHGARGLVYFVHEFSPSTREDAIFRHPDVVAEVTKINGLIQSLAVELNSPSAPERVNLTSETPIVTMVKERDNVLYVFAVAMTNVPSRSHFVIAGLGDAEARVLGEDRNVAIAQGRLDDDFEGYGVHIYEIPTRPKN